MAMQKEFIVIGLGAFGEKVVGLLNEFVEERYLQMTESIKDTVKIHCIVFPSESSFSYTQYSSLIRELVSDTDTRKNNGRFDYIIIGDLYEKFTATFGVDFAYLPWVLNNSRIILKNKVFGFFTFSDEDDKYSKESNALLYNYFERLSVLVGQNNYVPPYNDANGQTFPEVFNQTGPYDRNYIVTTPGDQKTVDAQTSRIFAERIFYELYYVAEAFEVKERELQGRRNEFGNMDKVFSTMSMVQISRIAEIQRYYLKCRLHEYVLNFYLDDEPKGTDLEFFKENFYNMLEFPYKNKKFPIDRAVKLFINKNKRQFENLLNIYVAREYSGLTDYIEKCKTRIDERLLKIQPEYEEFVKQEIDNLIVVLNDGLKKLFTVDRFAGNFKTYYDYLDELETYIEAWRLDLKEIADSSGDILFDEEYQKAEAKIKKIESSKIYDFPLFKPLRQKLINNAILSLRLEDFIISIVKKNLTKSFLLSWENSSENENHPVRLLVDVKNHLQKLEKQIIRKRDLLRKKTKLIEELNSYYYVISSVDDEKYKQILARIVEVNFGLGRKSELDTFSVNQFKAWSVKDKLVDVVAAPDEFLRFIEKSVDNDTQFMALDSNVVETDAYATSAFETMEIRIKSNCEKSFSLNDDFLDSAFILLESETVDDALFEKFSLKNSVDTQKIFVHKDFALGSLICFKDYIYIPYDNLQKKHILERLNNVKIGVPKYVDDDMTGEAENSDLSKRDKYCRVILRNYISQEQVLELYKKNFNRDEKLLSEKQINALARKVDLNVVVDFMDIDTMEKYAKDNGILFTENNEEMVHRILNFISKKTS